MGQAPVMSTLLNAVTATGPSNPVIFQSSRNAHSVQVKLGGILAATGVKVTLEGTLDLTNYKTIATWDLAAGQVDGDILTVSDVAAIAVRANLVTLTGGTNPTVTVNYCAWAE